MTIFLKVLASICLLGAYNGHLYSIHTTKACKFFESATLGIDENSSKPSLILLSDAHIADHYPQVRQHEAESIQDIEKLIKEAKAAGKKIAIVYEHGQEPSDIGTTCGRLAVIDNANTDENVTFVKADPRTQVMSIMDLAFDFLCEKGEWAPEREILIPEIKSHMPTKKTVLEQLYTTAYDLHKHNEITVAGQLVMFADKLSRELGNDDTKNLYEILESKNNSLVQNLAQEWHDTVVLKLTDTHFKINMHKALENNDIVIGAFGLGHIDQIKKDIKPLLSNHKFHTIAGSPQSGLELQDYHTKRVSYGLARQDFARASQAALAFSRKRPTANNPTTRGLHTAARTALRCIKRVAK